MTAQERLTVREVLPGLAVTVVVLVVGRLELARSDPTINGFDETSMAVIAGFAVAAGLARRAPGTALLLVWVTGVVQVWTSTPVLLVQASVAIVAFGCARWGNRAVVAASGVSIPVAGAIAVVLVSQGSYFFFRNVLGIRRLVDAAYQFGDALVAAAFFAGVLTLLAPWLAGLALRATARARASRERQLVAEEQADQAQEVARLRADQARLANDVHDVVGHSLAVILAQAESGQFLDDPERLQATLANIAGSARSSLQDVRTVLSDETQPIARPARFDDLVDGVRSAGRAVEVQETGSPRPLPPELDEVAHRVAQEMLTNAVKHGRRDRPIRVERSWPSGPDADLRIRVENELPGVEGAWPVPDRSPGRGLDGMRSRLAAVGGRLEAGRPEGATSATFVATAWVPVRGGRTLAG